MILNNPRFWIAGVSLGLVLGLVASSLTRTAPGPIATVHARLPELTGMGSCANCHGGWFGDMTTSCSECHAPIAEQIDKGTGLHGSLGAERARKCGTCHSEHHGAEFALVNRVSFALAGIADPNKFDHELVGWPMAGRHLALACKECHRHADDAVLPAGEVRYLRLQQDCKTCHQDAHDGRMVLGCASCHGQTDFKQLEPRGHEQHLPLVGGHADLDCRKCHEAGGPHAIEALGEGRRPGRDRTCADCHASPHGSAFVGAVAKLEGKPVEAVCTACHQPEHRSFRAEELTVTPAQHEATGFSLAAPHQQATCQQCHPRELPAFAARHPGRSADSCVNCHRDVHRGEFQGEAFAANGCIDCHARSHFAPHDFTVAKHEHTAFPLTGTHAATDCAECHQRRGEGEPARFDGTARRCELCHDDAHAGFFKKFAGELDANAAGSCAACHGTTHFAELPPAGFDHGRWTGFAISGAHEQAGCEACHKPAEKPDALGRRFGRVADHFGRHVNCASCHVDPHRGQFDEPLLPKNVGGRVSCARCHDQLSFRSFPQAFAHEQWTGFALHGAHGTTACTSCHPRLDQPDDRGRTWGKARGGHCNDCHQDPHAGQFAVKGRSECATCHRAAATFKSLVFRHDIHSRFQLGPQHENVACAACHKTFKEGDREVVRYRPLPMRCEDCHGKAMTPLPKRNEGRR